MNSLRLEKIAKYIEGFKRVCDIGCDHGYTLLKAFKEYNIAYAYAIDINEGPLNKAKENLKDYSNVEFLLADGLVGLDIDFEVAVISGMGGRLITKILSDSLDKFRDKTLVLEPQGNVDTLRSFLANNDFKIVNEEAFYDQNKYYEVIVVVPGSMNLDCLDLEFGPILRRNQDADYKKRYNLLLEKKKEALKKAKNRKELALEVLKLEYLLGIKKVVKKYYDDFNYWEGLFFTDEKRDLVITFPGGGYNHTSNREALNVGFKFNQLGYHSAVFFYREKKDLYPLVYEKIAAVIRDLKKDARVNRVFLNGFSAGGHVALELGLHQSLYKINPIEGLILCYPVVSSDEKISHKASFENLLGLNYSLHLKRVSEELEVNADSPKLFLWHTASDQSVSVLNSVRLMNAYLANGLSVTAHIYPIGRHGLGFADASTAVDETYIVPICQSWWSLLEDWLNLYVNK